MLIFLIAAVLNFEQMSEKELNQTGMTKLTLEERINLREWIEEHYSPKLVAQNKKSGPILQEVLKRGKYVRLSDNSLWEIRPEDTPITQSWITATEIKAVESGEESYPYTLTNSLTSSTVKARKIQQIPK